MGMLMIIQFEDEFKLNNFIIFLVVGECETLSLTTSEETKLQVSANKVLWNVLRLKKDKVRKMLRKWRNEKLWDLYSHEELDGTEKSLKLQWAGHLSRNREAQNVYRLFA